jgi:murein L,D-transpeptidase YcbB/YkuD
MTRRREKKDERSQLDNKYEIQLAQLEADGIQVKNKRVLVKLLENANGQVDVVKQVLTEKKHRVQSASVATEEDDTDMSLATKQYEIKADDTDKLKRLRAAGVHGNPVKILRVFHECNESIEMTITHIEKEREQLDQQNGERTQVNGEIFI